MRKVVDAHYFYQHQTINRLDEFNPQKGTSELLVDSNKYLSAKRKDISFHTYSYDINKTCNDDFVFCSISIPEDINEKPIFTTHQKMDFGCIAYLVEEHHGKYGYLTLYDQSCHYLILDTDYLTSRFVGLEKQIKKWSNDIFDLSGVPVFSYKDMKLAIGYYLINFLRYCDIDKFKDYVHSAPDTKTLNYILHTVFNLEYHIPKRIKITQGFVRHILYHPTVRQASESCDLFTLKKYCFAGYDSFSEYYQNILRDKTQDEIESAVFEIKMLLEKVLVVSENTKRYEHKQKSINSVYKEINDHLLKTGCSISSW